MKFGFKEREHRGTPPDLKPDSIWLVLVQGRRAVITISPDGEGFLMAGQAAQWEFWHVQQWIKQVWPQRPLIDRVVDRLF